MKGLLLSILFSVFMLVVVAPLWGLHPTVGELLFVSVVTYGVVLIQEEFR